MAWTKTVTGQTATTAAEIFLNVKDFGALGNAAADDTVAIQAAINAIPLGGIIFFPRGNYLTSATLTVTADQKIIFQGVGRQASRLLWGGGNSNVILDCNRLCEGGGFYDMGFTQNGAQTGITGVLMGSSTGAGLGPGGDFLWKNVGFYGLAVGVDGGSTRGGEPAQPLYDSTFISCRFNGCGIGYDGYGSMVNFYQVIFGACTTAGMRLGSLHAGELGGVVCYGSTWAGNATDVLLNINASAPTYRLIAFHSCWFESSTTRLLRVTGASGAAPQGILFDSCLLQTSQVAGAMMDFTNLASGHVRIHNCCFFTAGGGTTTLTFPANFPRQVVGNFNDTATAYLNDWDATSSSLVTETVHTTIVAAIGANVRAGDINRGYAAATQADDPIFTVPAGKTLRILRVTGRARTGATAGTYTVKAQLKNVGGASYQDLASGTATANSDISLVANGTPLVPLATLAAASTWNIVILNDTSSPGALAATNAHVIVVTYAYQ